MKKQAATFTRIEAVVLITNTNGKSVLATYAGVEMQNYVSPVYTMLLQANENEFVTPEDAENGFTYQVLGFASMEINERTKKQVGAATYSKSFIAAVELYEQQENAIIAAF